MSRRQESGRRAARLVDAKCQQQMPKSMTGSSPKKNPQAEAMGLEGSG
ncbi:hypothetical protein [Acidithiobacillus ferrooxidans]|nr:hypothetical protein [Acidithiobacillus ferrooxidans]